MHLRTLLSSLRLPLLSSVSTNIAIVSTFPPRECGLATFAADLCESLLAIDGHRVGVVAMQRPDASAVGSSAPSIAVGPRRARPGAPFLLATICEDRRESYEQAAATTNAWADVVIVEHEFGIFGGDDGEALLTFLRELDVPIVLTLHTVEPNLSPGRVRVLREACSLAAAVTVFTPTAQLLLDAQGIGCPEQVVCVPHGAPSELYDADRSQARDAIGVRRQFLLSSFGLLSAGKGLELGIEALAWCVENGIDAELVIAGKTHPDVRRREGEQYRESLRARARSLDVDDRVRFLDGFLSITQIADLLAATDVFVTPYRGENQIVSGALTFALAAGCAVVSTRYSYAVDQLSDGAGIVVDGRDPSNFAGAIARLLLDPDALARARARSSAVGADMRWSSIGQRMAALCDDLLRWGSPLVQPRETAVPPSRPSQHAGAVPSGPGTPPIPSALAGSR